MTENNKVVKIIVYILIGLVIVAGIGLIVKLTGGFSGGIQLFTLTVNDEEIRDVKGGYVITQKSPLTVEVNSLSDEYSVKVVPNAIEGMDFEYIINGELYSFQAEEDMTSCFNIEKSGKTFKVTPRGATFTEVLCKKYPTGNINENYDQYEYADMFSLIVTSGDGKTEIVLNFAMFGNVGGISLDRKEIVF